MIRYDLWQNWAKSVMLLFSQSFNEVVFVDKLSVYNQVTILISSREIPTMQHVATTVVAPTEAPRGKRNWAWGRAHNISSRRMLVI